MNLRHLTVPALCILLIVGFGSSCKTEKNTKAEPSSSGPSHRTADLVQVPTWSHNDLAFFLHGSMSTEMVPESVLRAFIKAYPDLFPTADLSTFGLLPDLAFGWPIGFSRTNVSHLAGLSSVGLNCAACHVGEIRSSSGGAPVRVLGMTSHFDAEAFFGAVAVATFRTAEPGNMKKFLDAYFWVTHPALSKSVLDSEWEKQREQVVETISADPSGAKNLSPGPFHAFAPGELDLEPAKRPGRNLDLPVLSHSMLKLFHNMRAALHIPDQPPDKLPPASGPGRNDAFGLLSAVLFGQPQPYAPVKYGLVWNLDHRHWVHWDGNTQSPLGRNLLASLGLGAPVVGKEGRLDFILVQRQTDLSEGIRPPRYPFPIDRAAANRGAVHYRVQCASCHDGPEGDNRLHSVAEIGTEPHRAELFTQPQADNFNRFLAELQTPGYHPSSIPGIRSTQKYWAASLAGVWARSPYLHNGSVRTMQQLLEPPQARAKTFHRGSRFYDEAAMGYADNGSYTLDTALPGNSNAGHNFGTGLSPAEKKELIEYLKML